MIRAILLDAANTIIHKPELWPRFNSVLAANGYEVLTDELRRNHKLISEASEFPDKTSASFYHKFNAELLYSLGIIPTQKLLEEIFLACDNLQWVAFSDVVALSEIKLPLSVLSNFNTSLNELLTGLLAIKFEHFIVSENVSLRKPDKAFYRLAMEKIHVQPQEILYIGDSIKLDMQPAMELNMNVLLIDRENYYPGFKNRIFSFSELPQQINFFNEL